MKRNLKKYKIKSAISAATALGIGVGLTSIAQTIGAETNLVDSTLTLPTFSSVLDQDSFFTTRGTAVNKYTGEPFNYTPKVEYPDYSNMNNFGEDQILRGPTVGGYVGIDRENSTQYRWIDSAKNTQISELILGFNTQRFYADDESKFDDNVSTMHNEGESPGNPYYNQIQAIHAMGKNVTLGFGGYLNPDLHNVWNTAPSAASLARLLEDAILAYGTHTLDFDIEGDATTDATFERLAIALGAVRYDLKTRLNYDLKIRFTLMPGGTGALTKLRDQMLIDNGVSDYVTNFMYNLAQTADTVISGIERNKKAVTELPSFQNISQLELNHRIGATFGTANVPMPIDELKLLAQRAVEEEWAFIGVWQLLDDHIINSPLEPNPKYQWSSNEYEFQTTQTAFDHFEAKKSFGGHTANLAEFTAIDSYYTTKQEIALQWEKVENADSYEVYFQNNENESPIKIISTTANTAFINPHTVANANENKIGSIWEYEENGTYLKDNENSKSFIFFIKAINSENNNDTGNPVDSSKITTTITQNSIKSPLYSFNGGVSYGNADVGRFLYFKNNKENSDFGEIWEITAPVTSGTLPNNESENFENIVSYTDLSSLGYSSKALFDLYNGIIIDYNELTNQTVSYEASTRTELQELPEVNKFLYDRFVK